MIEQCIVHNQKSYKPYLVDVALPRKRKAVQH